MLPLRKCCSFRLLAYNSWWENIRLMRKHICKFAITTDTFISQKITNHLKFITENENKKKTFFSLSAHLMRSLILCASVVVLQNHKFIYRRRRGKKIHAIWNRNHVDSTFDFKTNRQRIICCMQITMKINMNLPKKQQQQLNQNTAFTLAPLPFLLPPHYFEQVENV